MPIDDFSWAGLSRHVIKLFKSGEVKTPLSFVFRALTIFGVVVGLILYAPISEGMKWNFSMLTFVVIASLCAFIGFFTWFRPKNLVYGESGHKAEFKLEYGTEKKTIGQGELEELEPTESKNPLLLK